jgi:hypothetical protein
MIKNRGKKKLRKNIDYKKYVDREEKTYLKNAKK